MFAQSFFLAKTSAPCCNNACSGRSGAVQEEPMAAAAAERNVKPNAARLESDIDYIKNRITSIESDVKDLRARVESIYDTMLKRFDAVSRDGWMTRVWQLLIAAAILGVMARGFQWL